MKTLKKVLYTLLLMLSFNSFSQTYIGKVTDSNNQPIAYADIITINNNDKKVITGTITDENGNFKLKITTRNPFYLEIRFVGFETQKISPKKTDLGTIILKEQATQLNEIVVKARKNSIKQKVDRLIFNVENSVVSSGGSALDVLKATPSVQVNNNGISIIGKSSVRVLVNDRIVQMSGEELVNYLSSFSSDDIKNVEVITTPPAKYEAEGNGGLINIVLKKPKENSWSNQVRTTYVQTTYPAIKLGNTFNYNHKKWQVLASLDGKTGHEQKRISTLLYFPKQTWIDTIIGKVPRNYLSAKLGIDYQISPESSIGFLYSGREYRGTSKEHNNTLIFNAKNRQLEDEIKSRASQNGKNSNHSLNIHYLQKIDTLGKNFSVDLDYFTYSKERERTFNSQRVKNTALSQHSRNTGDQKIKNYSAKFDFQHPTSWANFSYGAKITQTKTDNDVNFYNLSTGTEVLDLTKSNIFNYRENTQALYMDITKNFGKKWQTKFGLRSEFTQTKGFSKTLNQTNEQKYTQLFPTFFINYTQNERNIFNLSYSRRIERPSFSQLNPFRFYINANSYTEGNPNLQPSFSNNLEFKYIFKGKFITKLFYYVSEDSFNQIPEINIENKQQYYTYKNAGNQKAYGVIETILYNPFKWWNTTTMVSLVRADTKLYDNINLGTNARNGWVGQFYTNQIFMLNSEGTIQAEATFVGASRGYTLIYEFDPTYYLDLGLKMQFLDKKLIVTAKLNDVFKSLSTDITAYTNGIKQVYNTYNDNRYFTLGLTYKFGNDKIRVNERSKGNNEEFKRAN